MGSLLYLISVFSIFDMTSSAEYSVAASKLQENSVEVEFATAPHLSVGDPVFFKGQLVGSVSKVDLANTKDQQSVVNIKVTDESIRINDQLVGLVAKIKVPAGARSKLGVRSALELIQVNANSKTKTVDSHSSLKMKLHGFVSFEEFWNSSSKLLPTK